MPGRNAERCDGLDSLHYNLWRLFTEHGGNYLQQQKVKAELAKVTKELRSLRRQIKVLEQRKANLLANLDPEANGSTKA